MENISKIPIFLGTCNSALVRGDGVSQDFYGVGSIILLPFYPQNLKGIFLLIGLPLNNTPKNMDIIIINRNKPEQKAWINGITFQYESVEGFVQAGGYSKPYFKEYGENKCTEIKGIMGRRLLIDNRDCYSLITIPCPPLFVTEPTEIDVVCKIEGIEYIIGRFDCVFCPTPEISEEEKQAIMSRPGARDTLIIVLSCTKCNDKVRFYLSLKDSTASHNIKDAIPIKEAGENWICKCQATKTPLLYFKKGMHELFRRMSLLNKEEITAVPMYTKGAIAAILQEYHNLLERNADSEEAIQKYLEDTPILWNFLAPLQIFKKPPILTQYKADFAILNRSNILYFIEIEKPNTMLIKKKIGISAELQTGLDQLENWRVLINKHRMAVLEMLNLSNNDVHDIRYILIAGMANKTATKGLEMLRSRKAEISIFCFDELASFLHSTLTAVTNI